MKTKAQIILLVVVGVFFLIPASVYSQVEIVFVEKYYVSDYNDATDTIGGGLDAGTITYRIYIDLMPGSKLLKLYGDQNHTLRFSSTRTFFNNKADGQSFAKEFSKSRYGDNTVALDSWLTLGQTTRLSAKTYFGIPKGQDRDGSFIGGVNNDGGSAAVSSGLLVNNDSQAGIPLTMSDGMDTMTVLPSSWANYGIVDPNTGDDSTIFGSIMPGLEFVSNNAGLQNSGVAGVNADSNMVLIAQLTTIGELSFELNVEVLEPGLPNPVVVKYVASLAASESNSDTLKLCPFLKYPSSCGCTDPNYLEYSQNVTCSNSDSCHTRIVYGCMDPNACNFDPNANFNVQQLCCYPGSCNDRNIELVCPTLSLGRGQGLNINISSNPINENSILSFEIDQEQNTGVSIYNLLGEKVYSKDLGVVSGMIEEHIPSGLLQGGVYFVEIRTTHTSEIIKVIVNN